MISFPFLLFPPSSFPPQPHSTKPATMPSPLANIPTKSLVFIVLGILLILFPVLFPGLLSGEGGEPISLLELFAPLRRLAGRALR